MRDFLLNNRRLLAWVIPLLLLVVAIGAETDWGRSLIPPPPVPAPAKARPIIAAVAPEYQLPGGMEQYKETVDRPLLAPRKARTRRRQQSIAYDSSW